jgi:hypothetical protein
VQYPELEMLRSHLTSLNSEYMGAANRFLALRLKASYRVLEAEPVEKYDAALYWRFLYEQFGSMDVVRAALEEMACGHGPDIEASLGRVMDAAFERMDGPFQTFEQSLVAFARANYALRLENGRCTSEDVGTCGGQYYDPHYMYAAPALEAVLEYGGGRLSYEGSIPFSFGSDLVDVRLDPSLQGQPARLTFKGDGARFSVQVWKLRDGGEEWDDGTRVWADGSGGRKPQALAPELEISMEARGTTSTEVVLVLNAGECDRLGLIITRLDPNERAEPTGRYTLTLGPA